MAYGVNEMVLVACCDINGDWWLLGCDEKIKDALDGSSLDDNGVCWKCEQPSNPGAYRLNTKLHWDDGDNGMFERSDPDWYFDVLSTETLYELSEQTYK